MQGMMLNLLDSRCRYWLLGE